MKFTTSPQSIEDLVDDYNRNILIIPEHQRPFLWKLDQQYSFIESLINGLPVPDLLFSQTREDPYHRSIEDGQQRILSIHKFVTGSNVNGGPIYIRIEDPENPDQKKKVQFNDLPSELRYKFLNYNLWIKTVVDVSPKVISELFELYQNGTPLKPGHRYHNQKDSVLVAFAISTLMSGNSPYYQITQRLWGDKDPSKDNKNYSNLDKAVCMIVGVAHGANNITNSYNNIGRLLKTDFDHEVAHSRLSHVLNTMLSMADVAKYNKKQRNRLWSPGTLSTYILFAFINDYDINWVAFAKKTKTFEMLVNTLNTSQSNSRAWNTTRWTNGIHNVNCYMNCNGHPHSSGELDSDSDYSNNDST